MAESIVALKWPRLVTEDLGAACTHPGDISCLSLSAEPLLAVGLLQHQRAGDISEQLPSVPVLAGEPHLGSPHARSCCQIQPSWKQEADLSQPLVGPTVPLDGAAGPVVEQQGERLGRAGAFPKKA